MKEMDQSVLAYLEEIKEENDRLIHQLNQRSDAEVKQTTRLCAARGINTRSF